MGLGTGSLWKKIRGRSREKILQRGVRSHRPAQKGKLCCKQEILMHGASSWDALFWVFMRDPEISHVGSGWRKKDDTNVIKMRPDHFKKAELNHQPGYI